MSDLRPDSRPAAPLPEDEGDPIDPERIYTITFDCYGTLIDWRRGAREVAAGLPAIEGCDLDRLIDDWQACDREITAGPYRPYGEVLAEGIRRAAARQGRELDGEQARAFARGQAQWPPFEESPDELARLVRHYQLCILSNVETAVLEASMEALGVGFECWVTAEEVRSYKPARAHFDRALEVLGLERGHVLHAAQSLHHDIAPAAAMGWNTAWIDRLGEGPAEGVEPDLIVPDLRRLANEMGC